MAKDSGLYVKRATIAALTGADAITDLVAERVYPLQRPANPVWPFIAYGAPIQAPFGATCLDGGETTVAIHNYAQTTGAGAETKSGEDTALQTNAAIAGLLDGATLDLTEHGCPYAATAHFTCTGSQVIQDGEADKFHGFVNFRITVSS